MISALSQPSFSVCSVSVDMMCLCSYCLYMATDSHRHGRRQHCTTSHCTKVDSEMRKVYTTGDDRERHDKQPTNQLRLGKWWAMTEWRSVSSSEKQFRRGEERARDNQGTLVDDSASAKQAAHTCNGCPFSLPLAPSNVMSSATDCRH